ncbi:ATP-grasp domain-containing protein [Luteimonas vadosa]|uniref:ATP-grasp domain-containing protein n=1 Tax=Luteimonas vadosa TaxID=1165507 RepID=A0ABP9DPR1_9GAMM
MAKVLLVDTNFSSGPIHDALLAMGHETHVVGRNPQDCLAKVSRHYWQMDYSDTRLLAELVDRERFDAIVPGCTDVSYASCVQVSQGRYRGLDTREAWHSIHDKAALRRLLAELGLPAPGRFTATSTESSDRLIVKPVDAFSGKGTTIVPNGDPTALSSAIKSAENASPTGAYLVEDFVEGQLTSHSAFIRHGRIAHDFFVREDGTANPFVVDTSHVLPDIEPTIATGVRSAVEQLAEHLGLVDGLVHSQFITKGPDFWLLEITRRCPGDLYSQLIELSTGFPYAGAYAMSFLGEALPAQDTPARFAHVVRHTVSLDTACDLAHVHFKRPLHLERWTPLALVGDRVEPSPASRVGVMFCRESDQASLAALYERFLARDVYEIRSA